MKTHRWIVAVLTLVLLYAPAAHALTGGTNISVSNGSVAITGQVGVANGGTAVASWSANNSVILSGTSSTGAVQIVAGGTAAGVLVSGGAGVAPTFTSMNLASSAAVGSSILPVANGGTNLSAASDDNVMVGNSTTWQSKALTTCTGTGKAVTYDASTNAFGCNTITAGVQAPLGFGSLGTITAGTTLYAGMGTGNISATETDIGTPMNAHTLQNLQCYTNVAPGGSDTVTTTLGVGTCGSALTYTSKPTCAVSAAGKTCSDTSNTAAPTAGQCVAAKIVSSATAATSIVSCQIDVVA
jgi:hypothetical protein